MNVAVKFYSDVPNPDGVPSAWPAEIKELPDGAPLPVGFTQLMSKAEYDSYVAAHQAEYDVWAKARADAQAATIAADQAERDQAKAVISDLRNGIGTTTTRILRCEKVLVRMILDLYK